MEDTLADSCKHHHGNPHHTGHNQLHGSVKFEGARVRRCGGARVVSRYEVRGTRCEDRLYVKNSTSKNGRVTTRGSPDYCFSKLPKYFVQYRRDRRASCYQRGNSHIPQIHMHDAFGLGNTLGFLKGMQRCWRYILHLVAREEATEMQGSLSQVVFS